MSPMKPVLFIALWLWPSSLMVYPTLTISPEEEKNLNHYVQELENLVQSLPGGNSAREKGLESSTTADVAGSPASQPKLNSDAATTFQPSCSPANSACQGSGTSPTRGFPLGTGRRRKQRMSTPFWSIKPNNVSVVLHAEEPYIEKEEPEPEPEPTKRLIVPPKSSPILAPSPSSRRITLSTMTTHVDISTEPEDVPQLSGVPETVSYGQSFEHHSHTLINSDILKKISDLSSQIQGGPLGDRNNPEYKEIIKAAREHLKRSLELAAATEHRLQKMYKSHVFSEAPTSHNMDDAETVINMLYNSRSKLPDYLDTKSIPSEVKERASAVVLILKKTLCLGQVQTQNLIRKLLSNNLKILNLLNIT